MPKAAPAEPKAVTGTAMDSALEKPKSGWRMHSSLSATAGSKAIPSYAPPVYMPSAGAPFVIITTSVQMISTPGIIPKPKSTPVFPPFIRVVIIRIPPERRQASFP